MKKTPVKKSIKKTQKKEKEDYEPTSDELRTALFLLTHKSTRKSNEIVKNELKDLIINW